MKIDQDRIRAILREKHSYYGEREIPIRRDYRWIPDWGHLIAPQLTHVSRVLDVGCGRGSFLLELHDCYQSGLGIDNDPEHLRLAEEAKRAQSVQNVDFRLLDFPRDAAQLPAESFDMIVSFRGPLPDTVEGVQSAYRLLRPEGLLFCEEIAELHQKEVGEIFFPPSPDEVVVRKVDQLRDLLEQNGFDVRLAADNFSKWVYPDVYAWVEYICNLWTWLGAPLPEPDDPRIAQFAEKNTNAAGEIVTTHHVAWIAGVKK